MHSSTALTRLARRACVTAALCALALVGGLVQAAPAAAATAALTFDRGVKVPGQSAQAIAAKSTPASSSSAPTAASSLPAAATSTVSVPVGGGSHRVKTRGAKGSHAATVSGDWQQLGGTGLQLAAAAASGRSAEASQVTVSVLSRAEAAKHHLSGLVLRIAKTKGDTAKGPVAVQVPQSLLKGLYGADYAGRVRWVQVPDTTATSAKTAATVKAETPVATATDSAAKSLVMTPQVSSTKMLVTAMSTPVSSTGAGSFAATSLKPSSAWQVSAQTGDFSWSYPMRVPPAPAGPAPALGLSYDSQSVDGETGSTNNQPSAVGEGWELGGGGFIERTYVSCSQDDGASGPVTTSGDLCWKTDNATIDVAGHSGTLVKDSTTGVWRLQSDDGTRFEHLVGAAQGCGAANGTYDDDCWRMTTTDGTQYYFGLNELPGWASGKATTNSAWTVPVYGNDSGEPCHAATFAASSCTQGWRWNLDYVVDTHGNAETFYYDAETNKYAQNGSGATSYIRGGQLDHIDYGLRAGNLFAATAASDKVVFGYNTNGRCASGCSSEPITSAATAPATPANYPDVPFDQLCTASSCSASQISPTFFTDGMLNTVTTKVLSGTAYNAVDQWTLSHSFPTSGDGGNAALWLTQVSHTGEVGGTPITEPPTTFTGVAMQNRVWVVDGLIPLDKHRITSIQTSLGAVISVAYSAQQCTAAQAPGIEANPQSNTERCFPQWWTPQVTPPQAPQEDLFHKYVVTSVVVNPKTGGGLDQSQETDYVYGTPAWRYDNSPLIPSDHRTWSVFAGYDTVEVRTGASSTPSLQGVTDYTFFRGLDGDRASPSGGTKSVAVEGVPDSLSLAGRVRDQSTLLGVGGAQLSDTLTDYWSSPPTANDGTLTAQLTGPIISLTTSGLAGGGTRTVTTSTTYNSTYGYPTQVDTVTSDAGATCTTTSYAAPNTSAWIIGRADEVRTVGVDCSNLAGASYPSQAISDTKTLYDGLAWGTAPTKGDVTSTQEVDSYPGGTASSAHWVTNATAAYDALGRVTSATDVLGHTTTTAYTPAAGGPLTQEKSTVTAPFSWSTTTNYDPSWGAQTSVVDQNANTTTSTYDALGRRLAVWLPQNTETSNPSNPSISYAYTESQTAANSIVTMTLTAGGNVGDWALYDGLGQQVQDQTSAQGGGTAVSSSFYDSQGRKYFTDNKYWTTSVNPSTTLFVPDSESAIPSQVENNYDAAGRVLRAVTNTTSGEAYETDYAYTGADRVDTVPPAGGTPSTSYTNSLGEQTSLVQYLSADLTGSQKTTTYSYTPAGKMATMTDPAGNTWSRAYDVLGDQTKAIDPDTGTTTSSYDDAGNELSTTDARGQTLTYTYDALNRKTAEYAGTASGSLLASWVYDTVAKGQLTSSSSYTGSVPGTPGLAYTESVGGYDAAYSPTSTTLSIPAGAPAFASTSYTTSFTYNLDEQKASQTDPAEGGLAAERLGFTYDAWGNLNGYRGLSTILMGTLFTAIGQLGEFETRGTYMGYQAYGYDDASGLVTNINTQTSSGGTFTSTGNTTYTRDDVGNVTSSKDTVTGQAECFSYDHLAELTQAWTPNASSSCSSTPSVSTVGGPAPFWDTYTYDTSTGNRLTQVQHATTAGGTSTTDTSTYPAAGAAHPHAVSSVAATGGSSGTSSYTYDGDGSTVTRPGDTITYDATGKPATVSTSAGTQHNIYDASGTLLLQVDPVNGATLFNGDTELHTAAGSTTASAVRTYTGYSGVPVAERTTTAGVTGNTLYWLFTDLDGTVTAQVNQATGAIVHRYVDPFGNPIGTTPTGWSDHHGFLNKTTDTTTGLTLIGARDYDPSLGRFTSVDPVFTAGNPLQDNGYAVKPRVC
jgi:RHS repeat-associated protein